MRLVMMGTGPFAVPTLRRLYASPHTVAALITRPPRAAHGKPPAGPNPMKQLALEQGTPIFEPDSINTVDARAMLTELGADLFVVCDYGQILAPETLAVAPLGGINLHASLLPKYRGAAPINWAIYHGEAETGVTVIHITPRVDAGPAIAQARTPIGPDETAAQLEPRLAELGAPLVLETIQHLADGTARPIVQNESTATRAPRLKKTDGAVDWSRTALEIKNQVRAMQPWPKTYTYWRRERGEPLRLILEQVEVEPARQSAPPGNVVEAGNVIAAEGERLVVTTGRDHLVIRQLQPAGKRVLSAGDFLRGYRLAAGERFSAET